MKKPWMTTASIQQVFVPVFLKHRSHFFLEIGITLDYVLKTPHLFEKAHFTIHCIFTARRKIHESTQKLLDYPFLCLLSHSARPARAKRGLPPGKRIGHHHL
jgi:hypothetical protein